MQLVESTGEDLKELILLLKMSIGEKLIPKSEAFFIWKHIDNPFGKSKIIVAKDQGKIVGLRSFMRWDWVCGDEKISAVRAVDTATAPAWQGKGIFKKLTLYAVEECIKDNIGIVFNTPNAISMNGYLKIGWQTAGRMPIYVSLGSIFPKKWTIDTDEHIQHLFPLKPVTVNLKCDTAFYTPITEKYMNWRYGTCPVVKYGSVGNNSFGCVFRVKPLKQFLELRICEAWAETKADQQQLRLLLHDVIKVMRPLLITIAPSALLPGLPLRSFLGPFRRGPVTTVRALSITDLSDFMYFRNWQPSMGSLELF